VYGNNHRQHPEVKARRRETDKITRKPESHKAYMRTYLKEWNKTAEGKEKLARNRENFLSNPEKVARVNEQRDISGRHKHRRGLFGRVKKLFGRVVRDIL
jgi:hypothetical protein